MRELSPEELSKVQDKILKYISPDSFKTLFSSKNLLLHNQRVFHASEAILKHTSSIARKDLQSVGACIGKFTKTNQFRITVTSLHVLANHGLYKIWVKNTAEMNFLYGNDVLKSHVMKTSENIPLNKHAFVFNQNDYPMGFGVTSKSSAQYSLCEGNATVLIRQSDVGEYLREQDTLF